MRKPSIKTLSSICENPKAVRAVFEMTREQLRETEAGAARCADCYHAPKTYDIRLHVLNNVAGFHGVEAMQTGNGRYADYLNAGDSYAPTIIYWDGQYRVQSIGDFVETMERRGVTFQ